MNESSSKELSPRETGADTDGVVSVVVPAFNEAENIPLLYRRVSEVLQQTVSRSWELIFADDGSRDATWSAICALAADDPKVRGVRLSRNFGHQYASWPAWRPPRATR